MKKISLEELLVFGFYKQGDCLRYRINDLLEIICLQTHSFQTLEHTFRLQTVRSGFTQPLLGINSIEDLKVFINFFPKP